MMVRRRKSLADLVTALLGNWIHVRHYSTKRQACDVRSLSHPPSFVCHTAFTIISSLDYYGWKWITRIWCKSWRVSTKSYIWRLGDYSNLLYIPSEVGKVHYLYTSPARLVHISGISCNRASLFINVHSSCAFAHDYQIRLSMDDIRQPLQQPHYIQKIHCIQTSKMVEIYDTPDSHRSFLPSHMKISGLLNSWDHANKARGDIALSPWLLERRKLCHKNIPADTEKYQERPRRL